MSKDSMIKEIKGKKTKAAAKPKKKNGTTACHARRCVRRNPAPFAFTSPLLKRLYTDTDTFPQRKSEGGARGQSLAPRVTTA